MMKQLASTRHFPSPMLYAYLCIIWHVDADSTYFQVKRAGVHISDYIAVRTIKGCGTLTEFNQQTHLLTPHTVGIFRSSDVARYESGPEGWEFYWFRFNHSQWTGNYNYVSNLNISTTEQKNMEHCFSYFNSGNQQECMTAEALFNYLLSDWLVRLNTGKRDTISLPEIVTLLEKWHSQKLELSEIAKEAGMSERSFRNTVYRICGMSPKEYITKIKMETALDLLQTTYMSISEISEQLHYDNSLYFSRVFKKYYGYSPKNAR